MNILTLEQTFEMNLLELIQKLKDLKSICNFFKDKNYKILTNIPDVVGIRYIDGKNNIWRPKWAREARGRFYWIGGERVIELKNTLQRGIEMLTKIHTNAGITRTDDINLLADRYLESLDDNQQKLMKLLSNENPIKTYLTAKIDGVLIIVNIYPRECEQYSIIQSLALSNSSLLNKQIVTYCVESNLPIITVSTHGTLFISEDFEDYFLKSLNSILNNSIQSKQDWADKHKDFANLINSYYEELDLNNNEMTNLCFESYCQNRKNLSGQIQHGLAISYDHDGFILLGMVNRNCFIPHFFLPRKIFKQPMFIQINNTKEIFNLIDKLDKLVLSSLSLNEFLKFFKMDNLTSNCVHPEGFVMLTKFNNHYDYAKLKTNLYYKCHKINQRNLNEILVYPECCESYYPIIKRLKLFFINKNEKLKSLVLNCFHLLEENLNDKSPFYLKQLPSAKAKFFSYFNGYYKLEEKYILFKIMLDTAACTNELKNLVFGVTNDIFQNKDEKLFSLVKMLLIKVEPWKEHWESQLDDLILNNNDLIKQIGYVVLGIKFEFL